MGMRGIPTVSRTCGSKFSFSRLKGSQRTVGASKFQKVVLEVVPVVTLSAFPSQEGATIVAISNRIGCNTNAEVSPSQL
eukprot:880522-Rhodomonas_salina.3